jgi:hypothetical protein
MDIFIRRLPEGTTRRDIQDFVLPALKPRWRLFGSRTAGKLSKVAILRIHDSNTGTVEFHGLIRIEPAMEGLAVIHRLNGTLLKSKRVEVRKYYRRSAARDRRRLEGESLPAHIQEQRKRDRRRHTLQTQILFAGGASQDAQIPLAV